MTFSHRWRRPMRKRPSIALGDLPADVRARVMETSADGTVGVSFVPSHVGPKALVGRASSSKRDESAIGRKRRKTGGDFEADLNMTHRQYELLKWGKIWPHDPPFVRFDDKWHPKKGGGPVDRTGHVRVRFFQTEPSFRDDTDNWKGDKDGEVIPIAFDAKVQDATRATYQHKKEQQHQLHTLRDAAAAGVFAFLLIYAPQVERLFALPILNHFDDLISRRGVVLFKYDRVGECFPLVPSIERGSSSLIWDWIPLLKWCEPGEP